MARNLFLCAVLCLAIPAQAMFEESSSSVRAQGMAGAFCAIADDAGAVGLNPGGLFQVESKEFTGLYKLLYGGAGVNLHTASGAYCMPVGRLGTMGLGFQETGFELHSERTLRFAHGMRVAEGVGLGYALNGYNLFQKGIGTGFGFGLDLGMFGRVYRVWTVGLHVHNINMPRIGAGPEGELPRVLVFGAGYSPVPGIHSAIDIEKEPGRSTRLRIGQEFRIIREHLTLRCGVLTEPVSFCFGLRTGIRGADPSTPLRACLDYALKTHAQLGLTHSLAVVLSF